MKVSIILSYFIAFTMGQATGDAPGPYCDYGFPAGVSCPAVCLYLSYNLWFISNTNFYLYI